MRPLAGVVIAAVAACADPTPTASPAVSVDRCPAAAPGLDIGGFAGDGRDTQVTPVRRVVLMGGGPEEDGAARRFAESAAGGDIVVLRATGSLVSYPDYFATELSPSPRAASVITIRTNSPSAAAHASVLCHLTRAEAVWLAGGSQWDYLGRWPTALHEALSEAAKRGAAVGGTSAGAVSLGEGVFAARLGTITSSEALANPFDPSVSVSLSPFPQPELANVLVDSHFTERSREGRLLVFLARLLAEHLEGPVAGIGLDEGAALEIADGSYRVSSARGGGVWMYEVSGPASLRPGIPLTLGGIRRVRLVDGDSGPWPFSFDTDRAQGLLVENGLVRVDLIHASMLQTDEASVARSAMAS